MLDLERQFVAKLYSVKEPWVAVTDMSEVRVVSPQMRRVGGDVTRRIEERTRENLAASIIIIGSPITRGIVIAVRWMVRPATEEHIVGSAIEAADVAERVLRERAIPFGAATVAKLAELRRRDS